MRIHYRQIFVILYKGFPHLRIRYKGITVCIHKYAYTHTDIYMSKMHRHLIQTGKEINCIHNNIQWEGLSLHFIQSCFGNDALCIWTKSNNLHLRTQGSGRSQRSKSQALLSRAGSGCYASLLLKHSIVKVTQTKNKATMHDQISQFKCAPADPCSPHPMKHDIALWVTGTLMDFPSSLVPREEVGKVTVTSPQKKQAAETEPSRKIKMV